MSTTPPVIAWAPVALGAAIVLASMCLWLAVRRWYVRRARRRIFARARGAETQAAVLLERLGYGVVGAQVEATYAIRVDGESMPVTVRADYVVTRDGRRFVAEVKSGRLAPLLANRATRRQLLEYLVAFDVDGVLLVDGETRRVHEVAFPVSPGAALPASSGVELGWIAAGLAIAAASVWIWLGG